MGRKGAGPDLDPAPLEETTKRVGFGPPAFFSETHGFNPVTFSRIPTSSFRGTTEPIVQTCT
jgi:hypothetical protein